MPFISIIVPVYNCETYLSHCIDSITNQSYTNWELILINDGSTDSSGELCNQYSHSDNRLRVIHKRNGGVSSARNEGIKYAKGEWLFFSDADDRLYENCLSSLVSAVSDNVDFIEAGYVEILNKKNLRYDFTESNVDFINIDYLELFYKSHTIIKEGYHGYPWNKLFRKSVIDNNQLKFNTSILFKEDCLFITEFICLMSGIATIIPGVVYEHIYRENGAMTQYGSFGKLTVSRVDAIIQIYSVIHKFFPETKVDKCAKKDVAQSYYSARSIAYRSSQLNSPLMKTCLKRVVLSVGIHALLINRIEHFQRMTFHFLNPLTYYRFIKRYISK